MLPLIALSSLLVLAAPGKSGGNADLSKILSGRDDVDFGRALAVAGYGDLAENLCFAIQRQYSGDAAKVLECEALVGDIHFDQANRETDGNKRREKLEKVLEEKSSFVTNHGDAPIGQEVAESLPNLYRSVGDALIALIDQTTDETQKGELRREAAKVFDEAELFLGKRVGKLRAEYEAAQQAMSAAPPPEKPDEPNPLQAAVDEAGSRYLVARSGLAQTKYFHATTLAAEDPQRTKLLNEVSSIYDDLELDFSDRLAIFDGFIFRGLAQDGLGNTDAALKSYDMAIRVRENFTKNEKTGVYPVPEEVAGVMSNAVHQKMLLLQKKGQTDEAIKTATDFFATTQDGYKASRAVAILAALADAYDTAGDQKGLERTANKLIEIDPRGPGKVTGLKILGGGGGGANKLSAKNLLALANQSAGGGETEKAMELCRQVLALARGLPSEQDLGAEACVLLGALYGGKERFEEAVVAWDTAMDRYPQGASAPEALWRSINGYNYLAAKQRRALWDKRYRERVSALATNFPKHPNTGRVTLLEGQRREDEGDFLGAAQIYEKIQKGSPAYEEAQFRAGKAYVGHARKLAQDGGKVAEAKAAYAKAEEILRRAMADTGDAIKKNLDPDAKPRLVGIDFSARVALAGVLLTDEVKKPGEVIALLEDAETLFPGDGEKLGKIWEYRFNAYKQEGKLEEGLTKLESALKDKNSAAGLDAVAVKAGGEFDKRSIETLQAKPDSPDVDAQMKKAFDWYMRGIAPQIEGRTSINAPQLESIAQRMLIFGLHLNRVPVEVQSFIEWNGKVIAPEAWTQAMRLYTTLLPYSSNPRTLLDLARVQAWLGKWKEASNNASKYFDREHYIDLAKKEIDPEQLKTRTDMIFALLEWGVIEANAAHGDVDTTHKDRAEAIYATLGASVNKDSKVWWQSKYQWMALLADIGEYAKEDLALRSMERNSTNYDDGKFGLAPKFKKLRADLDAKLLNQPPKPK
jgi:tetratricopeptide (TPR) repeat protein